MRIATLAGQLSERVTALADIAVATRTGLENVLTLLGWAATDHDSAARSLARETERCQRYRGLDHDLATLLAFCGRSAPRRTDDRRSAFVAPTPRVFSRGGRSDGLRLLIEVRSWSIRQSAPRLADAEGLARALEHELAASDDPFLIYMAQSVARAMGDDAPMHGFNA
ncbi:MAG: hypothetical protein JHC95_14885 [Solirubrobacteraceae bacterium]|nr:hypothetical protein [Solirubrobacteraceae bacterium]